MYEDTPYFKNLRRQLTIHLQRRGITDKRVLNAIDTLPRQFFMHPDDQHLAYEDKAYPIGEGQTISQPYTVAYQTQLLDIAPGDVVLEIGTGSAYQACILAIMGAEVYSMERQKKLYDRNKQFTFLQAFRNLQLFYGDGYVGLPSIAPFDRILLTAAAPHIPHRLIDQLQTGGKLVAPVGTGEVQVMIRLTLKQDGTLLEETFDRFSFVPMLRGTQN